MIWLLSLLISISQSSECSYPEKWWAPVTGSVPSWEILPQSVSCNEKKVILSKRNELGILSNFADTAFTLDSRKYASVEGFWQMMKYPEDLKDLSDPRNDSSVSWPYTREQVSMMSGSEAKDAGKTANANLKKLNINWITYTSKKIEYKGVDQNLHYKIIYRAMKQKMIENPEVKSLLIKTKGLELMPDHKVEENPPKAYRYYDIWMELREEIFN